MAFDARAAWTGSYGEGAWAPVRLEAAAWHGRPVYFEIADAWHGAGSPSGIERPIVVLIVVLFPTLCVIAGLLAYRNVRSGRGDRKGAARLAVFVFLGIACARLLQTAHVASPWELTLFVAAISFSGFWGAITSLGYLAIEPYARRRWPDCFISWNRIMAGRFRDPLVASHVLAGMVALGLAQSMRFLGHMVASSPPVLEGPAKIQTLNSVTAFAAGLLGSVSSGVALSIGILVVLVVFRTLFRVAWIADLLAAVVLSLALAGLFVDHADPFRFIVTSLATMPFYYAFFWLFGRFGLVAVMAMLLTQGLAVATPYLSFTAWYASRMLVTTGITLTLAGWSLWVIVSDKRSVVPSSAP